MNRDEIVAWLADYAREFALPVREGVTATGLTAGVGGEGFRVATTDGDYRARDVGDRDRLQYAAPASLPAPPTSPPTSSSSTPRRTAILGRFPPAPCWWWAAASRPPRSPRSCCGTGVRSTWPPGATGGGRSGIGANTSSPG